MDHSQKTILLIKIAKGLRMLGNGLLIIVFIQNLYEKEIIEYIMFTVQAALYIGTMITSYLIKKNQHRIGTKNALLLATLIMTLTSIVFSQSQNLYCLFGMAFIGLMPVIGEQLQIFSSLQQTIISKLLANKHKSKSQLSQAKQTVFRDYKIIGNASQIIGCIIVSYFLSSAMKSVQTSDTIVLYILRGYTILVSLQFLVYLSLDKEQIQTTSALSESTQSRKQIIECIRPGIFMFLTFIVFFCTSILNMTNFLYFLHQKYQMQIHDVAPIIISLIFINYLGGYLTKKIVEKGCSKIWLLLGLPFNLMFILVALTQRLNKLQAITIVANLLTNSLILNVWQKLKQTMISQYQLHRYQGNFSFFQNLGTVLSIIVYAIFSIFGGTTIPYSVSIIICGAVKFFISIALVSCLSCLGNFSYNSKPQHQVSLHDTHFQQIKSYAQESQNLHLPNTH